ncbi:MAG: hypothetical protein LBU92_05220, partial [Prevotellaceae bacterium]|nr:hypothetical protein [Prevotellaceae bacterium]
MKTKHFFSLLALAAFATFAGCADDPEVAADPTPTNPALTVSSDTLRFAAADEGIQNVTVTSELDWTVGANVAWIHITEDKTNNRFRVTVDANATESVKTGTITVENDENTKNITVIQTGLVPVEINGTRRYETVPFSAALSVDTLPGTIPNGLLRWSYDDDYVYYEFLLGHINNVPIAYKDAVIYAGTTPITITYEWSEATEEAITNSATTAVENSVTNTSSVNASVSIEVFGVGASVGAEYGWEDSETRSTSNTYETTKSVMKGETFSISATVGGNGETPGKYRYSLFVTTDVYYTLILNRADTTFNRAYTTVSARTEGSAWGIDYEPNSSGNFEKTGEGEPLQIPNLDYAELPFPEPEPLPEEPIHPFGVISFRTAQTWTVGTQIWSDAVVATQCKKNTYDGGTISAPKVDCRQITGHGDLFSWEAVNQYKADLCPDGWRVPTSSEFIALDVALGGTGQNNQNALFSRSVYEKQWGIQYGGGTYFH